MIHPVTSLLTPELEPAATAPAALSSAASPSSAFALLLARGNAGTQDSAVGDHSAADTSEPLDSAMSERTAPRAEWLPPAGLEPAKSVSERVGSVALHSESGWLLPDAETDSPVMTGKLLPPEPATRIFSNPHSLVSPAEAAVASTSTPLVAAELAPLGIQPAPVAMAADANAPNGAHDAAILAAHRGRQVAVEPVPPAADLVAANRISMPTPGPIGSVEAASVINPSGAGGLRVPEGAATHPAANESLRWPADPRLMRAHLRAEVPEPTPLRADKIAPQTSPEKAPGPVPLSTAMPTADPLERIAHRASVGAIDQHWLRTSDARHVSESGKDALGQRQTVLPSQPETLPDPRQISERPSNAIVTAGPPQAPAAASLTTHDQGQGPSPVPQSSPQITAGAILDGEAPGLRALDKPANAAPQAATTLQLTLGNRQELGDRLGTLLGSVRSLTGSQLSIALAPQELGRLEIRMTTGPDQSLNVSITTQHAGTRDLVEAQLNRLKTALDSEGFERVQVDLRDERGGRSGARQDPDPQGPGARWPGDPNRDGSAAQQGADDNHPADLGSSGHSTLTLGVSTSSQVSRSAAGGLLPAIDAYA